MVSPYAAVADAFTDNRRELAPLIRRPPPPEPVRAVAPPRPRPAPAPQPTLDPTALFELQERNHQLQSLAQGLMGEIETIRNTQALEDFVTAERERIGEIEELASAESLISYMEGLAAGEEQAQGAIQERMANPASGIVGQRSVTTAPPSPLGLLGGLTQAVMEPADAIAFAVLNELPSALATGTQTPRELLPPSFTPAITQQRAAELGGGFFAGGQALRETAGDFPQVRLGELLGAKTPFGTPIEANVSTADIASLAADPLNVVPGVGFGPEIVRGGRAVVRGVAGREAREAVLRQADRAFPRGVARAAGPEDAAERLSQLDELLTQARAELEGAEAARAGLIRPVELSFLTDAQIEEVARRSGQNPFRPDWFDSVDPDMLADFVEGGRRGRRAGDPPGIMERRARVANLDAGVRELEAELGLIEPPTPRAAALPTTDIERLARTRAGRAAGLQITETPAQPIQAGLEGVTRDVVRADPEAARFAQARFLGETAAQDRGIAAELTRQGERVPRRPLS
ncbi:hypothetical protein LCGC14_2142510, partial [marine sediment metagenome]